MKNYTNDDFAKWLFRKGLKIKNYNYDVFYDISRFASDKMKYQKSTENPIYKKYVIFFREHGSHLFINDFDSLETFNLLLNNNEQAYQLTFCFNSDYFRNIPFVSIKKIK